VACQWRRRLHYLFVDEYQDINGAQDKVLETLSRNPGDGAWNTGNRFLVGDVKQSIYRFRLADPTLFRGYERRWKEGESGRIALTENFRSHPEILGFVNRLFRALMRESVGGVAYEDLVPGAAGAQCDPAGIESDPPRRRGDAKGEARDERDAEANGSDGSNGIHRVEVAVINKADRSRDTGDEAAGEEANGSDEVADLLAAEREARLVALRLRDFKDQRRLIWDKDGECHRPASWGDMAVLLRSPAGRVEAFAKEFARAGIPLEAARGGFFDSVEIQDLVGLLKLLDNPLQDIPLLAVLRSPLAGMTLAELAEVRAGEPPDHRAAHFWLAVRQFAQQNRPADPGWHKLRQFLHQLRRWRGLIRRASLSLCLETALGETDYEALLLALPRGEERVANVRRLLAMAREYDPFQRQGLFRFLRFIEAQEEVELETASGPANRDAVRLMSIHKSKGLEFPVVALAGLGSRFNFRDLRENILVDGRYGLCPKVIPPEAGRGYPSLPYWLARRRQCAELLGEELRLLYVAMTRARDLLLLTGACGGKADAEPSVGDAGEPDDRDLLRARSPMDWLKLRLPLTGGEARGPQRVRIDRYSEDDPRLALREPAPGAEQGAPAAAPGEAALSEIRARLGWAYPFLAASERKAKSSVTELRGERDEDAEPARFLRRGVFALEPRRAKGGLAAAEIGVAHHRFLQRVTPSMTRTISELRAEADRMRQAGWLSEAEVASLDLKAIAGFWESDFGRFAAGHADGLRRELQFTARFTPSDLAEAGLEPAADLAADEFVVVQGMVDLAVILPGEIRLVDFKTDVFEDDERDEKVRQYKPQVKLYALALERIYGRPVTECRLYFLSRRESAAVD
jgi:ATP-dependent helicase/nuclease subunit A